MADEKPKMIYNAPRFKVKQYDWDVFVGPAAGEPVGDYTFTDLDGNEVKLSDYRGKWVVLETGSSTCSMYSKNIPDMKEVIAEFSDVAFLLIYVREAHPGERLHQHKSFEEKMAAAKLVAPRYKEPRKVLVDSIDGAYHLAHGAMPNTCYIVRPDGIIHYRCNWTTTDGIREALGDRENFHTVENADVHALKASRGIYTSMRTMWTGGFVALWDFFKAGPQLAKRHKLVDDYYAEHGKFKQQPSR